MGDIGHAWTYKPTLSIVIILISMACMVQCSDTSPGIGVVYPRGNHWAVGHLMGKKSLESLSGAEESDQDSDYPSPSEEDKQSVRYEPPSRLYGSLLRTLLGRESQTPPRLALLSGRQLEERERDKRIQQVTGLLLQALNIKENSSS